MIVPQYWAEARIQQRIGRRQVTVRRFGWSDDSQAAAQAHADARVREAFDQVAAGAKLMRREMKVAYHGADGLPIREEIVERHGETVITRNSYGARCLNTPNVLFGDIDFDRSVPAPLTYAVNIAALLFACLVGWERKSFLAAVAVGLGFMAVGHTVVGLIHRLRLHFSGGPERRAHDRVTRFCAARPDWHLRLYRTPAGLRFLAMHRTFDPAEPAVAECFTALGVDRVYIHMCLNQHCFRARVTAKPWRIGIGGHMRPRPGVWPVNPARLAERNAWIAQYEQAAQGYAACRFMEEIGNSAIAPEALAVQNVHDELCRAQSSLPTA